MFWYGNRQLIQFCNVRATCHGQLGTQVSGMMVVILLTFPSNFFLEQPRYEDHKEKIRKISLLSQTARFYVIHKKFRPTTKKVLKLEMRLLLVIAALLVHEWFQQSRSWSKSTFHFQTNTQKALKKKEHFNNMFSDKYQVDLFR